MASPDILKELHNNWSRNMYLLWNQGREDKAKRGEADMANILHAIARPHAASTWIRRYVCP